MARRPQRRRRLGAVRGRPGLRRVARSAWPGPPWPWNGPRSGVSAPADGVPGSPWSSASCLDRASACGPWSPGGRGLRRAGRPGGRSTAVTLVPARRGVSATPHPRHRVGGALRPAVVAPAGALPLPAGAARRAPPRPARPGRGARARSRRAPWSSGPATTPACPAGRGPTSPATPVDGCTGAPPRTPAPHGRSSSGPRPAGDRHGRPPADPDEAERAAEHALGTGVALLGGGATVLLGRREAVGPGRAPVADRRRPAAAWPGPAAGRAGTPTGSAVSVLEAIRRANQPGRARGLHPAAASPAWAPSWSPSRRAPRSRRDLAWTAAVGAVALVSAGMVFSYGTRARPPGWMKVVVAAGAIGAFVWFFHAVARRPRAYFPRSRTR